jgi:hypothetical protein
MDNQSRIISFRHSNTRGRHDTGRKGLRRHGPDVDKCILPRDIFTSNT